MKIGYACIPLTLGYTTNRGFILKNFNEDKFINITRENLKDLKYILQENLKKHIYFFRISSDIIPFASHPINKIEWWNIFSNEFKEIGEFIKKNKMRVSMHCGQYTVLNSSSKEVVKKSIKDIEYHVKFLDCLKLDYSHKIVLHVGGIYGDKKSAIDRFKNNFRLLSYSAKNRIIIENDEKMYNINEVLKICEDINVPAVFDNLHHKFNKSLDDNLQAIFKRTVDTWKKKDGKPKIHYSDSDYSKKIGAHSLFVDTKNFMEFFCKIKKYDLDIMLEVKDKDISAIKCINCTIWSNIGDCKEKRKIILNEWNKYKYIIMERGEYSYNKGIDLINNTDNIIEIYEFIDECLKIKLEKKAFVKVVKYIFNYFEDIITRRDKNDFNKLISMDELNYKKVKEKIYKLSKKYNLTSMLENYYFYYL